MEIGFPTVKRSAYKTKSRRLPTEQWGMKPGYQCDFPGCTKEAKYGGRKKKVVHHFCFAHFKRYYGVGDNGKLV